MKRAPSASRQDFSFFLPPRSGLARLLDQALLLAGVCVSGPSISAGSVCAVVQMSLLRSHVLRPPHMTAAYLDARVTRQPPMSEMIFLLVLVFLYVFFPLAVLSFFVCAWLEEGHVSGEKSLFGVGMRGPLAHLFHDGRGSQRVWQEREGLTGRQRRKKHKGRKRKARKVRGPRGQRKGRQRRRPLAAAGQASPRGNDVRRHCGYHIGGRLGRRRAGPQRQHGGALARRGDAAAAVRLVRHLHREGGAGGGGEGAGVAGAAGVVVGALGGSQATGARDKVRRAGLMMGVRGAGTPRGAALQRKNRAVRRGGGGGLRRHLLIGRQLEGSQKTCKDQIRYQSINQYHLFLASLLRLLLFHECFFLVKHPPLFFNLLRY